MSLEANVRMMARTHPFDLLPHEALQLLVFSCAKKPADAAYFVLSGAINLMSHDARRRVEAGALIGETALLTDLLRRSTARAADDTVTLRVPGDVFRRVLSEFPQSAARIHAVASARARDLVEQLEAVRERGFDV